MLTQRCRSEKSFEQYETVGVREIPLLLGSLSVPWIKVLPSLSER